MKRMILLLTLCTALVVTGCAADPTSQPEATVAEDGTVTVGNTLTVGDVTDMLDLESNMDTLSADGLYYASWTIGDSVPYENSDGDTVDLYDAQLYLVLAETTNRDTAQENMDKWLAAAKENYEILSEEETDHAGQDYTVISYNCISEDNPFSRGVSAFGFSDNYAVCIELTCQDDFSDDLQTILARFLDNCSYTEAE
jgi:hypothetical protein